MRYRSLVIIIVLIFLISSPVVTAQADLESPSDWEQLRQGITYKKFHITEPRDMDIFVAAMDRSNLSVTVDSGIAQGRLSGGLETVRSQAARYDQTINYWDATWGNRSEVVVAINGYYFNQSVEPIGVPLSGQIHSGWYAKQFTNIIGDAGFSWTMDRQAFIGDCVYHSADKNDVLFVNANYDPNFQAVNIEHSDENMILYTPQYDVNTRTISTTEDPVLEIAIELSRPSLLISDPGYVRGRIMQIRDNKGSTPLRFDYVVLSLWGDVRTATKSRIDGNLINIGDEVRITQEIKDCAVSTTKPWVKTYSGMGGDYHFLNDGTIREYEEMPDAVVGNSRSAIVYNDEYIFFIVVDKCNPNVSEGIKISELGTFAINYLGANWGVSLDSGGSSTMVVLGDVVNNTSLNNTTCSPPGSSTASVESYSIKVGDQSGNILENVARNPADEGINGEDVKLVKDDFRSSTYQVDTLFEPFVANSMMIVAVKPMERSSTFSEAQKVYAKSATNLYLGPGTNYGVLGTTNIGSEGEVASHGNDMNGVLAKGAYWWFIDFGEITGWVREDTLQGGTIPGFTPTDFLYFPSIHKGQSIN